MIIMVQLNSSGLVVFDSWGDVIFSENVEIVVGDEVYFIVVSLQEWNVQVLYFVSYFVWIGWNVVFKYFVVLLGGSIVWVNFLVYFVEDGVDVELFGVYFVDVGQYFEQCVYVYYDVLYL